MTEVIVGTSWIGKWETYTGQPERNPTRIPLEQACREIAAVFKCTEESARLSLLKHGYASTQNRDWRMPGRGYDEGDQW